MSESTDLTDITFPMHVTSLSALQALAHQRGESVEQTAQYLLESSVAALAPTPAPGPAGTPPFILSPDDPNGAKAVEALLGSIPHWPGMEGPADTTNEDIDRLIGEEAMNPHDDE